MKNSKILKEACEIGNLELVKLLIEYGHKHNDALFWVSCNGYTEIVKLLKQYLYNKPKMSFE